MAIIYKKGSKELEYTGIDKAFKSVTDTATKIKSVAKAVVTRPARAMKAKRQGDAKKELDNISRAFGSVENYEKMYPETSKRNQRLRKEAYEDDAD